MVETMGNGIIWALLGAAIATGVAGIGSIKGVGMAAETAMGAMSEDSSKFGKMLVLVLLPGTQGLYGLVVWFFALLQMGVFGGNVDPTSLTVVDGLRVACACLPMATGAAISAPAQGRVAATAVNLMAKRPDDWAKGIILCITVEFYAILSLLASFLMLLNLHLGA